MSLSLVLPCYNVMKYLPKCLDSIFKNDCSDIEIILVNDGSSDDIGGGLSQYFNKDNCDHNIEFEYKDARIKIIHTCNSGVSAARNTGIENATSDYIVFIDPDDTIKENYFSTIKAFMTSTSVDVAILGFYQIVEDKDGNMKVTEVNIRHMAYAGVMAHVGFDLIEDTIKIMEDGNADRVERAPFYHYEKPYIFLRDVDVEPIILESEEIFDRVI